MVKVAMPEALSYKFWMNLLKGQMCHIQNLYFPVTSVDRHQIHASVEGHTGA